MRYRADIDGLRAVAVVPVVLFHAGLPFVEGGYVGVDVFFVISGYVITWRILEDIAAGRFSILDFYERRIRRIIPALLFTVILCIALALAFLLPPAMAEFSRSVSATAMFVSNFYFWKTSGYFDIAAYTRPLLHSWSLSVEEQFYVFIPIVLYVTYRYFKSYAALLLALLAFSSLVLSIVLTHKAPTANFFLLPTRAWELLIGCLLATAPQIQIESRAVREMLGVIGFGLIGYAVFNYSEVTPFPGAAALLPAAGAALLIFIGKDRQSLASALLSFGPLVAIGLISYSLYLVHWPIVVFTRYYLLAEPGLLHSIFIVIISLVLAVFSWRFIERPFRSRGIRTARPALFAGTASALVVTGLVGAAGVATDGFQARFPEFAQQEAAPVQHEWKVNVCFLLNNQRYDAWKADECMRTTGASQNALLWGDSFAAHYVSGLIQNADRLRANIIQYTFAGCPPILSYQSYAISGCQEFNSHVFEVIRQLDVKTVILSTRWDLLRARGVEGLRDTVAKLSETGVRVYVIGQSPTFAFDTKVLAYRGAGVAPNGSAAWTITFDPGDNERIQALAGNGTFIDPLSHFCQGTVCTYMKQQSLLFFDYGHFSDFGSDLAVRTFFPLYAPQNGSPSAALAPHSAGGELQK